MGMQREELGREAGDKMNTKIISVTEQAGGQEEIYQEASEIIRRGGLVAFPTETVYGLGADGLNEEAAAKIYLAKGRPSDNPLILHIAEVEQLEGIVKFIPETAKKLIKKYWPGPLTLIFEKADSVPYGTTGGLETVAVRMPDHIVARRLIQASGVPIAAPSANTSGRPSPTKASHVTEDLFGKIDLILDSGSVGIGLESTIVDVTVIPPVILRPGYITQEMLTETLEETVSFDPALIQGITADLKPKAPGMKYRHYAPKAELLIVEGDPYHVAEKIEELAAKKAAEGKRIGIIGTKEFQSYYRTGFVKIIGTREKEETIAQNLYCILREFDELQVDMIFSEGFPEENFGQAIMNRLVKAAGNKVIKLPDNESLSVR